MQNYLTDYALENIWCEPRQDRLHVIRPARLTKNGGAITTAPVGWIRIALPDADSTAVHKFYHVYQIGQRAAQLLNIVDNPGVWYPLKGLMESNGLLINAYLENGAIVPPSYCWVMLTHDKNVLFAIENVVGMDLGTMVGGDSAIRAASLDHDDLRLRFYSSAWFDTAEYTTLNSTLPKIRVTSQLVTDANDFSTFWTQCSIINSQYDAVNLGLSRYYVDGFEVDRPTAYSATKHRNRTLTMVRDTSLIGVADFGQVVDLESFTSIADVGVTKYILMSNPTDRIQYFDDIDFIMTKSGSENKSVIFPVTMGTEIKTLLHNAWSIHSGVLATVAGHHEALWSGLTDVQLRAYIRQGGHQFDLVDEARHLRELIKMSREEILGALTGVSASITSWRADNLESSAFAAVMGSSMEAILNDINPVVDALGYNSCSRLMSDPVKAVTSSAGQLAVEVPEAGRMATFPGGVGERTIFTYNSDGKLVNFFRNMGTYTPALLPGVSGHNQVKAEVMPLKLSTTHDGCFYMQTVNDVMLKTQGFRAYVCDVDGDGDILENWVDITDTGAGTYFTYDEAGDASNGYLPRFTWDLGALSTIHQVGCIKVGGYVSMLSPELAITNYPGIIRFSVNTQQTNWPTGSAKRPQKLQPGRLDVFMGTAALGCEFLVEDIDYYVNWPEIVITRIPPALPAEGLLVYVRLHGFCNSDTGTYYKPREVGFVRGGWLSVDGEYDIRNDRAIGIVVGGRFMLRDSVRLAEDDNGNPVSDGRPFAIYDYQMPIESYTGRATVPFLEQAMLTEDAIQAYLDLRKSENVPGLAVIDGDRWKLYSPFFSAILHAFDYGFLDAGQLDTPYESTDITAWVAPYMYLLDYDPCAQSANLDYLEIRPHQYSTPVTVTAQQFTFLHKINLQFLGGKVSLSPSIVIGA